jgi:hypothetical protein
MPLAESLVVYSIYKDGCLEHLMTSINEMLEIVIASHKNQQLPFAQESIIAREQISVLSTNEQSEGKSV